MDKSFDIKKYLSFALELIKIVVIAAAIVIPIRYFLFQPFFVEGQSMDPNFASGDYLIIDEISYRFSQPERGDVIVFKYPVNTSRRLIKRIIGLPGETIVISNCQVIINDSSLDESAYLKDICTSGDMTVVLGNNEYFVLGDNREFSFDSRSFGILQEGLIIGRVFIRAWPIDSLERFGSPSY